MRRPAPRSPWLRPLLLLLLLLPGGPRTTRAEPPPSPIDTLDVETVLRRRDAQLDTLLLPESVAPDRPELDARAEELDRLGAPGLDSLGRRGGIGGGGARFRFETGHSALNRVEGARVAAGGGVSAGRRLHLDAAGGYAFGPDRWVGEGTLTLGRRTRGPALQLAAADRFITFGPDEPGTGASFLVLVAGQDRVDYLRRRGGEIRLLPLRERDASIGVALFHHDESSATVATDWSLFGGNTPMDMPNPAIDEGISRGARLEGTLARGGDLFRLAGEAGVAGEGFGGDFDYAWQDVGIELRPVLPDGGVLSLALSGRNTAGAPPAQEEAYLGGDATLRGYQRLEYTGRRRLSARIEYESGFDLLARTGIGFLRKARIQFIPFADVGTTWGDADGVERTRGTLEGEARASFGLGLQRDIWMPGAQAVRLDLTHRADGNGDAIQFWFRFIPYE